MGILRPLPEPAAHSFDRRLDPFIDQLYLPRRQNSVAPSIGAMGIARLQMLQQAIQPLEAVPYEPRGTLPVYR
jgi:hypothetical protein